MTDWLKRGNTAVITGGANGIGYAAAERFLKEGMNVLIADNNEQAMNEALEKLPAEEGQLAGAICDVSQIEQVQKLKDTVYQQYGDVHCLMNNAGAGLPPSAPWEELDQWKKQIDINMWGIIHGCHAFIPSMLEASEPVTVINTGSKQGITNPPGGYAYNLSKAGVLAYTQSTAHALRQIDGCPLSVHLLVPGFTYSNMIARFMPEKPDGAWTTDQVVDFMLTSLRRGDFYVICPDNDTPRKLDEKRIQWNADDLIRNRPALSRWHPDYSAEYDAFVS
jgi:NAD(P)-dependent dehydrogenase (short-subunit alcohol dehydrogenase family)